MAHRVMLRCREEMLSRAHSSSRKSLLFMSTRFDGPNADSHTDEDEKFRSECPFVLFHIQSLIHTINLAPSAHYHQFNTSVNKAYREGILKR